MYKLTHNNLQEIDLLTSFNALRWAIKGRSIRKAFLFLGSGAQVLFIIRHLEELVNQVFKKVISCLLIRKLSRFNSNGSQNTAVFLRPIQSKLLQMNKWRHNRS